MAITDLKLTKDQPNITINGQDIVAAEKWILSLDAPTKPIAVGLLLRGNLSSYGFPAIGDGNEIDTSLKAINYQVKQVSSKAYTQYHITVNYSNNRAKVDESVAPADAQPTYSFSKVDNMVILEYEKGKKKKPNQNSAGTPLAIEVNEPHMRLTINRNEEDFDHKVALQHIGKVNKTKARILGKTFNPQTMMLEDWSGTTEYDNNGNLFWKVTYQIIFKDKVDISDYNEGEISVNGFKKIVIDKGFYDSNKERATLKNGSISGRELKLDGSGNFFDVDSQSDSNIVAYLQFDIYEETEWPKLIGFSESANLSNNVLKGQSDGFGLQNGGTILN